MLNFQAEKSYHIRDKVLELSNCSCQKHLGYISHQSFLLLPFLSFVLRFMEEVGKVCANEPASSLILDPIFFYRL